MESTLEKNFGGRIRVRICGILIENNHVLLAKHQGLGEAGFLWNPPGGGAHFGETYSETLKREFLEETNLIIEVGQFLIFNEYIKNEIHALELFFEVKRTAGELKLGADPELSSEEQMLVDLKFWSKAEILEFPKNQFHSRIFNYF
jgi:8-oxo-dGTP diphosphatase